MTYQVVCIAGNAIPGSTPITDSLDIGRDPHCDIRINDDICSRFHAQISITNDLVTLRDNNSSNGTLVQGQKIQSVTLVHSQQFTCGTCTFIILDNDAQSHETHIISDAGTAVTVSHSVDTQVWQQGDDPTQLSLIHHVCRSLAKHSVDQRAHIVLDAVEKICHSDSAAIIARGACLCGNMSERLSQRLIGGQAARLFILGKDLHGQTIAEEAIGSACSIPLGPDTHILVARSLDKDPFTHQHLSLLATLGAEASLFFPSIKTQLEQRIVGESPLIKQLRQRIQKLAHNDSTVLITGPSGTGKELVARSLHQLSGRHHAPFIAVNCGAVSDQLFEAELFGHEKGAFTGADQKRIGRIQAADGGTLFLDEIGELSLELQVKLLRVLQEKRVCPVGSNKEIPVNMRVIAATNRDLQTEIQEQRFREDLYYRIDVLRIRTPSLQERSDDIPYLAIALLERLATEAGRPCPQLDASALHALEHASWPGNVRQLENILQRALAMAETAIRADDLDLDNDQATSNEDSFQSLAEMEAAHIQAALQRCQGNKSEAARLLGISRPTIHKKIGDYGLG